MHLLKSLSKYVVGTFLVLIVGFITTPILTRLVSTEEMGKYSMFITLGNLIFTLLCLGFDQSYLRFFNNEDKKSRNYLLKICMFVPLISFFVASIFMIIFYGPLSIYINGKKSFWVVLLFIIYIGTLIVDRFWSLKIQMSQREIAFSFLNIIRKLSYLVVGVVLISVAFFENGTNLMLAVTIAEFFVLIFAFFIESGNWKIIEKKVMTSFRTLTKYGLPFTLSSTIVLAFHSTDKIMLKALSDYHNIGIYSGAQNIVNLLSQAQAVFVAFWIPVVYEHFAKNPEDKTFYVLMNKIVSYAMLCILIVLICFKDVIIMLLGPNYHEAVYVFPFLAFMPVMNTISETTVMGINFKQKTEYHIYISLISMLVNAIGNYYFINLFGATGAAISTGLSYGVFFLLRTHYAQKVYPIPFALNRYWISVVLVYLFSVYASFNIVDLAFLLIAITIIIIVSFLYRDIIKYCLINVKNVLCALKKKRN